MKKVILIKYGELTTKKDNRKFFIKTLKNNIIDKLNGYNILVTDDYYRMFIEVEEDDIDSIIDKLTCIFGIHEIAVCYKDENVSEEEIKKVSLMVMR